MLGSIFQWLFSIIPDEPATVHDLLLQNSDGTFQLVVWGERLEGEDRVTVRWGRKQASVKVTGKKPGTWITRTGKSCTYGITLIKNSPNPSGAVKFLEFMLSPDGGLKVLKDMGQPPFVPTRVSSEQVKESLPGI